MLVFPIDSVKDQILSALNEVDFLIIKSTPGSGKTTRVPLMLAEKYKKKIYVLEPRKLAAKLASQFVAKSKGEVPGLSVGHIFKYERCASDDTQIIFLTEGTFLRILTSDPELKQCDVVILDEFHERHYQTDVALSFLLKIKENNPTLKIIIMSATINLIELENLLKDRARIVEINEHRYKLKIEYLPNDTLILKDPLERKIKDAIYKTESRDGHILVFLPGMFEIKKCETMILQNFTHEIVILHGEISGITIDESFYDLTRKKIILSTNIAESSVTIPGVRTVIDSGLHHRSRLNPVTRLPMLELQKISQSSAIQRASRSSREDDGLAIRLYAEFDYQSRVLFDQPEINRTDLSELILTAADLFGESLEKFSFTTKLEAGEIIKAQNFLEQIGMLEKNLPTITAKRLSHFPFHPRISKILFEASQGGIATLKNVIEYLSVMVEPRKPERFKSLAQKFFRAKGSASTSHEVDLEKCMLSGYLDQISKIKGHNQLIHRNGETYTISPRIVDQVDPHHPLWIILDLDNRNHVTRMLPIEEAWLYDLPSFPILESETFDIDINKLKIKIERVSRVGAIILTREKLSLTSFSHLAIDYSTKKLLPVFAEKLAIDSFKRLEVMEKYTVLKIADFKTEQWFRSQVEYLLSTDYGWEQLIDAYIKAVFAHLNQDQNYDLDSDLPLGLQLHDRRKVDINYDSSNGVHVESFIQDFYGLKIVPTILRGKEKIKIHLIGPHKRPLQVTQDLKSFWDKTYKELVGELKRDYPRHYWPELPQDANPILLKKNVK